MLKFIYLIFILLFNAITISLYANKSHTNNYRYLLSIADNEFTKNNLSQAIISYQKCIQFYPKNPESYYQMGLIHKSESKFDEAMIYFKQALNYQSNFIFKEDIFKLKFEIAQIAIILKNYSLHTNTLLDITSLKLPLLENDIFSNEQKKFYDYHYGRAFFYLGLFLKNNLHSHLSKYFFNLSFHSSFFIKLNSLHLAYYYKINEQAHIDLDNLKLYEERYIKEKELQKENRNSFFKFYYSSYLKNEFQNKIEKQEFKKAIYKNMLNKIIE